jgi:hypothetical protein
MTTADCDDRRFIDDIRQVRSDQAGSGFGNIHQIYIRCQFSIFDMHLQNGHASFHVGAGDGHMAVKATGADQEPGRAHPRGWWRPGRRLHLWRQIRPFQRAADSESDPVPFHRRPPPPE